MGAGPLQGIRVLEVTGIGPAPLGCMMLADLGAEVLRIDRPGRSSLLGVPATRDVVGRGRRSVAVDLKHPDGAEVVRRLAEQADVLVDPYRPGVAERLGIGPDDCCARNPRLVYARMTGWGQDGPLAQRAGHDIDYAAITGAIAAVGEPGRKPVPPMNLVADFGGGSTFLVVGVLAALLERATSGRGQVVDAAMVDGVSTLLALAHTLRAAGRWRDERGANLLDGGAPYYDTYQCADGEYVAVGALEPQFFAELVRVLGIDDRVPPQHDIARWPEMRALLAETFAAKPRDEWAEIFADTDACVAPVLWLGEAAGHDHIRARGTLTEVDGTVQPAPAPRFSRTPGAIGGPSRVAGADTTDALVDWGIARDEVDRLLAAGAVAQAAQAAPEG